MWPSHPLHKHFCALLFSVAIVATYVSIKEKLERNNKKYVAQPLVSNFGASEATQKSHKKKPRLYLNSVTKREQNSNHTLYILGLFEMTTKWGGIRQEGLSEISAAQLAVEHVNRNAILPGYTLELLINDTQCDPGVGIDRFFHALYSKKTIIMLLGSSFSNVTERLAYVVPYWNILQMKLVFILLFCVLVTFIWAKPQYQFYPCSGGNCNQQLCHGYGCMQNLCQGIGCQQQLSIPCRGGGCSTHECHTQAQCSNCGCQGYVCNGCNEMRNACQAFPSLCQGK